MDKNNHIDDIFRSKLGDYQPEYVPEHWQMMKDAIESSQKTIPVSSISFTSKLLMVISALIIIGSGVYTYVLTQKYNSLKTKDNIIAQVSPKKNTQTHYNDIKNNNPESGKTSSPVIKNISTSQNNNIKKEKDVPVNSNFNKSNSQKKQLQVQNSILNIKSKKTITPSNDNSSKNEKPLINNADIATLSNKKFTKANYTDENEILIDEPVTINNIQPQEGVPQINNEQIKSNNDVTVTENLNYEENNYTSVIDDYVAQKQKFDKKHKKEIKQNLNNSKISESLPDCKVSMVNDFVANPAFAGFNQRHTISLSTLIHKPLYKPSNDFNVPFEYSIAYDFNFGKRKNCGIGIDYKRFLGAAEGSLAVDLTFAYRINLAKYHNLRLGASASYIASDINKSDMTFPDMIDSRNGFVYNSNEVFPNKTTKHNFDLGMGVWYSWKTLYVGVSAIHLTSPEIGVVSKSKIPREYMLSAGYGFNVNKSLSVLPATELRYIEKIINISPSMLFTYKKWLLFGMEFQNLRNAGIVLGCNLKNNVIINIYSGVPMSKDIIKNFGVIDYAGLSLRFQLGNYR